MENSIYAKPIPRRKKIDMTSKSPLDDIQKMGEILLRHTSEKEYYQFCQLQEHCRLKWQITIDKFSDLLKDHEKCVLDKNDLAINLKHISELWEMEKETRRNMECERNFYKMKLNQTYDLLRYDQGMEKQSTENENEQNKNDNPNNKNNDEITSTGSFLSNLSGVSETVDYYGEGAQKVIVERNLSTEFVNIFGDMPKNDEPALVNKSPFEKTFQIRRHSNNKREKDRNNTLSFSESESDRRVQSPPKRQKKHLHVSEDFSHGHISNLRKKQSIQTISSTDVESNPVYDRIDTTSSFDFDSRENIREMANAVTQSFDGFLQQINTKPELLLNPNRCQHSFSHHTAPQSIVCFLCSKKFRIPILAFKCTNCSIFVHHDCKSQMKMAAKTQGQIKNINKHLISDYVPAVGPSVPALIVHCVNEVETRGLSERGIYRVSGSEKEVKALKDRFLMSDDIPSNLSDIDIHVICGCIKIFLRGLNEPLIPTYRWAFFSNAVFNIDCDLMDGNIQAHLQSEIARLPKANRDTLAFLILHLQRVATCAAVQMPISNLAKIFGPTVVGYSKKEPDYAAILGETAIQQNVMQYFLNISTDYWFSFISEDI